MTQPAANNANVWLDDAARFDRMLAPFNEAVFDAGIEPGFSALDVGCGAGAFTFAAAERMGHGAVIGVDRDPALIDLARARMATGHLRASVSFTNADAATVGLPAGSFDALISRFGMMLFEDPEAAFAHLGQLLRPGGRIGYVTWTEPAANDWFALPFAAAGAPVPSMGPPFRLADPDRNTELLRIAGCSEVRIVAIDRPVFVGVDAQDVMSFVRRELPADTPASVLTSIEAALADFATHDGVYVNGRALVCSGTLGTQR
jgi:SAM-dependent methyltransferase